MEGFVSLRMKVDNLFRLSVATSSTAAAGGRQTSGPLPPAGQVSGTDSDFRDVI